MEPLTAGELSNIVSPAIFLYNNLNLKGLNLVFFKTLRTKGDEIPETGYDILLHSMYFVSRGGEGAQSSPRWYMYVPTENPSSTCIK